MWTRTAGGSSDCPNGQSSEDHAQPLVMLYNLYDTGGMTNRVQIAELRANLRDILDEVRAGQTVTVLHYSKPIARITPYQEPTMSTIADIARDIAAKHDNSYDATLTAVTTYAAQLDYEVPEGGQAPDVEITATDAEHIAAMYDAMAAEEQ